MKINWRVRLKNPLFWAQLAAAVLTPVLAGAGLGWEDMTSWQALGQAIAAGIQSPVVLAAVAVSVFNAVTDPTTKGIGDSKRAMEYERPMDNQGI